jgi:hypothetical protein
MNKNKLGKSVYSPVNSSVWSSVKDELKAKAVSNE